MGWSAGRHVDHPGGWGGKFRHGLLEKSLNNVTSCVMNLNYFDNNASNVM